METFELETIIPAAFREKEKEVVRFVHLQHFPQKRKYSGQPYVVHLVAVASLVKEHTNDTVLTATALCHDLFEDTSCSENQLRDGLSDAGFSTGEINRIDHYTWDLTDRFTKKQYPRLNRRERKQREAERMKSIAPASATVKLADMIENLSDLLVTDTDFAAVYLREARMMLPHLEKGNPALFEKMTELTKEADRQLSSQAQQR